MHRRKEDRRIPGRGLRRAHIERLPARVRREGRFRILNISSEYREVGRSAVVFLLLREFARNSERGINRKQIVVAHVVPCHCQLARGKCHAGHELMTAARPIIDHQRSAPLQRNALGIRGRDSSGNHDAGIAPVGADVPCVALRPRHVRMAGVIHRNCRIVVGAKRNGSVALIEGVDVRHQRRFGKGAAAVEGGYVHDGVRLRRVRGRKDAPCDVKRAGIGVDGQRGALIGFGRAADLLRRSPGEAAVDGMRVHDRRDAVRLRAGELRPSRIDRSCAEDLSLFQRQRRDHAQPRPGARNIDRDRRLVFKEIGVSGIDLRGPEVTNRVAALDIVIVCVGSHEYFAGATHLAIEGQTAVVEHPVRACTHRGICARA